MNKPTKPMPKRNSPANKQMDFETRLLQYKTDRAEFLKNLSKKYLIAEKTQHGKKTGVGWIDRLLMYLLRKRNVGIAFIYNDLKK